MNDGETNGAFNQEDRDFSCSIPDRAERKQANIEEALRRIQKMGPSGFLNFMRFFPPRFFPIMFPSLSVYHSI